MPHEWEAAEKPAVNDATEKVAKNDSLNLLDLKADKAPPVSDSNNQTKATMKGFPDVEMFDSTQQNSPKKIENQSAINAAEKPQYKGTNSWAELENYTLATAPVDSMQGKNRDAVNVTEEPKTEGKGGWAALEKHTLATSKPEK